MTPPVVESRLAGIIHGDVCSPKRQRGRMSQSTLNAKIYEASSLADASGYIATLGFLHEEDMNHPGWRANHVPHSPCRAAQNLAFPRFGDTARLRPLCHSINLSTSRVRRSFPCGFLAQSCFV